MTTVSSDDVAFSCPVIAPSAYIVKGPSGWTETFNRKKLDEELTRFLHPVPPHEMAMVLINTRLAMDKPDPLNWFTVVGFLGRTLGVSPRTIPPTVAIAFWAHIELAKREEAAN